MFNLTQTSARGYERPTKIVLGLLGLKIVPKYFTLKLMVDQFEEGVILQRENHPTQESKALWA